VGLKPTHGLLSRNGIIPLALSFDTGGPMTRSVYDAAAMLSAMTGIDAGDEATRKSQGKIQPDYTKFLKRGALKGARIGIARDFMGFDADVDWTVNAAAMAMQEAGATVVEVRFPTWFLSNLFDDIGGVFMTVLNPEFKVQLGDYLAHHTGPKYPKSMEELLERSYSFNAVRGDGVAPNPVRWADFQDVVKSPPLTDYHYKVAHDYGLPMMRALVEEMFASEKLDAIVYPTSPRRPGLIEAAPSGAAAPPSGGTHPVRSATSIANLTGFPDLIVPAGFTGNALPVGISFFGLPFSEGKLFALGYDFEQKTHARRRPAHTPALGNSSIEIP
jgi:amidase